MSAVIEAARAALEAEHKAAGAALRAIPGIGSGRMGLTPDHVKASPDYRAARAAYDRAFAALRRFNGAHKPAKRQRSAT